MRAGNSLTESGSMICHWGLYLDRISLLEIIPNDQEKPHPCSYNWIPVGILPNSNLFQSHDSRDGLEKNLSIAVNQVLGD